MNPSDPQRALDDLLRKTRVLLELLPDGWPAERFWTAVAQALIVVEQAREVGMAPI